MYKFLILLLFPFFLSSPGWVANDITGVWLNSDEDAHIKIYYSYGKYFGIVDWMKTPIDPETGKPQLDKYNQDVTLRTRPVLHLVVVSDLTFDTKTQEWTGGKIYNPKSGGFFDMECAMIDQNTMKVHFFLGVPAVGKFVQWRRIIE